MFERQQPVKDINMNRWTVELSLTSLCQNVQKKSHSDAHNGEG